MELIAELPWAQPGWRARAQSWIEAQVAGTVGAAEEVKIRPWSAVLRQPAGAGDIYFKMLPPGTAFGMDLLKKPVADLLASPDLAVCQTRFPATGQLQVRFHLPSTDEPNDAGEAGKISATYGGPLADTPLARCVADAVAARVLSAPVPPRVAGAVLFRRIDFPLAKAAKPAP